MAPSLFHSRVEYFLRAARAESFNAAAFRLGVTQSTLSAAIKKLEDDLGARLFDRGPDGVRLTARGEALFRKLSAHERTLDEDVRAALDQAQDATIRIGVVTHFATFRFLPLLRKLGPRLPKLHVYTTFSLHSLQAVEAGELDFAFVAWTSPPRGLKFVVVRDDPFAIVGLRRKFAHLARARSLKDLAHEPWVHLPKPQYEWTRILEPGQPGFVARDSHGLREIILGGFAIGDVQLETFSREEQRRLVAAPVPSAWPNTKVYVVHRPDLRPSARDCLEILLPPLSE